MTRMEQIALVNDLTERIAGQIVHLVTVGKVPAEWDGHELRELIGEKFYAERTQLMRARPTRRRNYRNTVLVNNL